jgi:hypothetical protein
MKKSSKLNSDLWYLIGQELEQNVHQAMKIQRFETDPGKNVKDIAKFLWDLTKCYVL